MKRHMLAISASAILLAAPAGRAADTSAPPAKPVPAIVLEPAHYRVYWTLEYHPGSTFHAWYPAYVSTWPTYGRYVGALYYPLHASGTYAPGYTPWLQGNYPWVFNSWPVATAWDGPFIYTFRGSSIWWRSPNAQTPPVVRKVAEATPAKHLDDIALYSRAVSAYRDASYSAALDLVDKAIGQNANDPRYWYVKAVAERRLGKSNAAEGSAQRAAAIEVLARPDAATIGAALESIQGPERQWLRNLQRLSMPVETARELASAPLPGMIVPASGATRSKE